MRPGTVAKRQSVSPRGEAVCGELVELFQQALKKVGAPQALVQKLPRPINKADTEAIGTFCDAKAASLEAKQNSYVPRYNRGLAAKILAHSTLVAPMETKEFVYVAKTKGEKTLICTFPGHWRLMRTDFTVH